MVLKETNNNKTLAVEASRAKAAGRRTQKKGSRVTEERAKAQRAKLDKQAEARPEQEEQEVTTGQNCLRNLSYYLDKHRPDEEELADWGNAGEDHLFLSETRLPLTKNGMEMLFKRLKTRAGIVGKRVSPHIFRHTFAMNYLIKSNDPFSLQELLGHEDLTTVLNYIHMNDTILQEQKRKNSRFYTMGNKSVLRETSRSTHQTSS